jgi:hypothetical protein
MELSMCVEVKTTVRFRPFAVPAYAHLMIGLEESRDDPAIPIAEMEREALDALHAPHWATASRTHPEKDRSMIDIFELAPSYYAHSSRPCCGTLDLMCPRCSHHRVPIATCTGPHAGNDSSGVKRWKISGQIGKWETVSLEPSVNLHGHCEWHGIIQNGEVTQ